MVVLVGENVRAGLCCDAGGKRAVLVPDCEIPAVVVGGAATPWLFNDWVGW